MNEQPGSHVLNLECRLDAPPEGVFRMLTEATELVKWWGPDGFTLPSAELNLVPAGRYRFRTRLALSQGPFLTEERLGLHRDGWSESLAKLRKAADAPIQ